MINESYALAKSIADSGIITQEWHTAYKLLPKATVKAPCLRLWVSDNGEITGIEEMNPDAVSLLRKYGNNQGTFPAFNIKPLFRITDSNQKMEIAELIADPSQIKLPIPQCWLENSNWQHKGMKKIDNTLQGISQELLNLINTSKESSDSAVTKLIEVTGSIEGGLHFALTKFLLSEFERGEASSLLLRVFFHLGDEDKAESIDMGDNISVILDLQNWDEYGYPIAHERTTGWINRVLLLSDKTGVATSACTAIDAFGSSVDPSFSKPMPVVRFPGFNVTLRAMFKGKPCQQRYGFFDDSSYPIAQENRSITAQSLEWLVDSKREKSMWRRAGTDEYVFAYPSSLAEIEVPFVDIFLPSADLADAINSARFENVAEDFLKVFNAAYPGNPPDSIRVFSVKKMDAARTKIVLTRNVTPEYLLEAVENWRIGCLNAPQIRFAESRIPFPLKVPQIINTVWKRDGSRATTGKTKVERMRPYQGLELLLDPYQNAATAYYLQIVLVNTEGYVSHFGNNFHRGEYLNEYNARIITEVAAVLGLLLHRTGYYKEDYMQDTPYLIGQMLKVSDELHTLYCMAERKGDIPLQLAGNSMFSYSSEMPYKALAQLGLRMHPYITWAKKYRFSHQEKNDVPNWKAGWYLNLYQDLADNLEPVLSEKDRFNDFGKAQLFLGYLADFPKRNNSEQATTTDADISVQEKENENES